MTATLTAPLAPEAEAALLGAMLQAPECIAPIIDTLYAHHFADDDHARVYRAICGCYVNGGAVDAVLVSSALRDAGDLGRIGGPERLVELAESCPLPANAEHYARAVRDAAQRRAILRATEALARDAGDPSVTPDELRQRCRDRLALADPDKADGGAVVLNLADVEARPVEWLWPGRIATGKLTMVAGDPGLGKSFLSLDIAARTSTGSGWPDAPGKRYAAGGVVLLSAEDDPADTIRPRLDAAAADVTRIALLRGVRVNGRGEAPVTLDDVGPIRDAIAGVPDCRLVVVDPISAYLGRTDSHVNSEVRALLAGLSTLAQERGVAVVVVSHLNKSGGSNAIYRVTGSLAFTAAARAVCGVVKDRDDPARRLFLPIKNNLGPDAAGLAYRLDVQHGTATPCVAWEAAPVTLSAQEAMSEPAGTPGPKPMARDAAADWLRHALADGPRPSRDVEEEAREAEGFSRGTLIRARREAGVETYRPINPGPWYMRLVGAQEQERST